MRRRLISTAFVLVSLASIGAVAVWISPLSGTRGTPSGRSMGASTDRVEEPRATSPTADPSATRVVPRVSGPSAGLLLAGCGLDDAEVAPFETLAPPCTIALFAPTDGRILDAARVDARPGETVEIRFAAVASEGITGSDEAPESEGGQANLTGDPSERSADASEPQTAPATVRALAFWENQLDDLHEQRDATDNPLEVERIDRAILFINERLKR